MHRKWASAAAILLAPAALLTLYPLAVSSRPADAAGELENRVTALQAACDKLAADNKALAASLRKSSKDAAERLDKLEFQVKGLNADLAAEKAKVVVLEKFKTTVETTYKPAIDRLEQKTRFMQVVKEGPNEFTVISMGPRAKIRFQVDGNLVISGGKKHWHSNTWE